MLSHLAGGSQVPLSSQQALWQQNEKLQAEEFVASGGQRDRLENPGQSV